MKAAMYHKLGGIRLDDAAKPEVQASTDAPIRITATAIRATDLDFVRGTVADIREYSILGHEAGRIDPLAESRVREPGSL